MSGSEQPQDDRYQRLIARLSIIQTIPAVAGILIGCIALYAALNEADAVRKQQEATVWPHVQIDRTNERTDTDRGIYVTVRNRGIGPARIRTARVTMDGEEIASWDELFQRLQPDIEKTYPRTDSRVGESVLAPNEDVRVIDLGTDLYAQFDMASIEGVASREETEALIVTMREVVDDGRFLMELCYCSVFDECWEVNNRDRDPRLVEACTPLAGQNSF